jgi:SCP-2 sterol transfer family
MFVAPEAANFQGTYEISLRGGPIIAMSFYDGRLTFAEGNATRPDCRVSANPSSFLLSALGRLGLWSPAFKGQMLAYGRKPWLAFRLPSLLRQL